MTDNELNDIPLPEESDDSEPAGREKPAITIVIQSWATPILAILILVIGLAGGYFGRPLIEGRLAGTPTVVQQVSQPQSTAEAPSPESRAQLMAAVQGQARHFYGDENAPVTLIEFSDFQ